MLEKYESAIDKIRRIDDLKDELKTLKGENGKISSSTAVYRKKNDWREKNQNDAAIKSLNERRYAVSKREALIRAEIKSLKAEVYDILSECFAEAATEEHRAKIREACLYASDGVALISQTGRTPAAFGKCKIVGRRATRDRNLNGKVEKVLRAGIKNTSGKFLILPEIVVYYYDENVAEGEYTVVNEYYPPVRNQRPSYPQTPTGEYKGEPSPALEAMRGKFACKQSVIALVCALVYSGFYLWGTLIGVAEGVKTKIVRYAAAYFLIVIASVFACCKNKNTIVTDGTLALFSLYAGALTAFTLVFSKIPLYSFAMPLAMLLGGIVSLALAPQVKSEKSSPVRAVIAAVVGVVAGLFVSALYGKELAYFAYSAFGAVALIGLTVSVYSAVTKNKNSAYALAFCSAFCLSAAMLAVWQSAVALGVCAAVFACFAIRRNYDV